MVKRQKDAVRFLVKLRPNCSGSVRSAHLFMGFLLAAFIPTGVIFAFVGAWPVLGFMGGELMLLYAALRFGQRQCGVVERISISPTTLTVERVDHWGALQTWSFPPQWLRVELDDAGRRDNRLNLRSHGKSLTIGRFLTPDERLEVAATLRRELIQLQRA